MKDLGYELVDVIQVDLDKTKEKALNIALNKISGEWDYDLLNDLLLELNNENFDISLTGFEELNLDLDLETNNENEYKESERERTNNTYNLELYDGDEIDGYYQ